MIKNELEQLENLAEVIDAEATATEPGAVPEQEAIRVDVAAEVAALLKVVAGILTPAFPCLAGIYTESTCRSLGEATAPVLDKYGLSVGALFDRWGAEITLAAVALPVGLATVQGIKADMAARRAQPPAQKQEAAQSRHESMGGFAAAPVGALVIAAP